MKRIFIIILSVAAFMQNCGNQKTEISKEKTQQLMGKTIYDYKVESLDGGEINFADFKGKKILIAITGSIAAYKIPLLVRLLIKDGAEVKVVMTPSACDFVTPLTLSTLSQSPVYIKPFNETDGSWTSHIELGSWADVMLFAPLSANTMAKMATGITDNLLTAVYLAARCPVYFAPAMDVDMYNHPTTQANITKLQSFGNLLIAPAEGELASGLTGFGRLEEPANIFKILECHIEKAGSLNGVKVMITSGPTIEPIDPVRYISNHSSGQMGNSLAMEAAMRGDDVTLITGEGVTITPTTGNAVSLTTTGLDNGSNKITNVADGAVSSTSTDGINGSQLYDTANSIATVVSTKVLSPFKAVAMAAFFKIKLPMTYGLRKLRMQ